MGNKPEHKLDFFRPDQITFLVTHGTFEHNQLATRDMLLKDWLSRLNEQSNLDEQLANKQLKDFIAECNEQVNNDEQLPKWVLDKWKANLKNQLGQRGWELAKDAGLNDLPLRSYSFPAIDRNRFKVLSDENQNEKYDGDFSIIVCNVMRVTNGEEANLEHNSSPADYGDNKKDKPEQPKEEKSKKKQDLFDLILKLDIEDQRQSLSTPELTVEGVSPNWITSSSKSDSGGTGGPGGRPTPYAGLPGQADFFFEKLIDELKGNNHTGTNIYGDGTGVDVIILDTAPSAHDLVLAHKELVLLMEEGQKHRLIEHLLGPGGRLKLYPATYEEHLRMGNTSLNKHGYEMTDHGLFIAGIIHSIVPKATIHLIEVLNQFGVGDLETLARGLSKAETICNQSTGKAVINGSWCLDLPDALEEFAYQPSQKETIPGIEKEMEEQLRVTIASELDKDELRWVLELRVMCERLGFMGSQVVAAAGNKAENAGQSRHAPDASYPAAFSKVVGVGALPHDAERNDGSGKYNASSYSNQADKPEPTGIMALGGEEGEEEGVLGVYLGQFPPDEDENGQPINGHGWPKTGPKSENGWAWWAGTSFATPILTGAIASVLSGLENPSTTQQALGILYRECIIKQAITEIDEDGIPSSLSQYAPPHDWPWLAPL